MINQIGIFLLINILTNYSLVMVILTVLEHGYLVNLSSLHLSYISGSVLFVIFDEVELPKPSALYIIISK
jgi:hypothetical protein